ncbi:MAG: hypothetical protein ABI760_02310 [Ferruginibacter sp.]
MESHFFVDIHCHSSIKAYARSFRGNAGEQSSDPEDSSSIWHRDAPSLFDKIKNFIASLTNFIQSDATSLIRGRVCVVCLSFYPQEKGFFINKVGTGIVSDALTKLASEFGQERIDHLQELESYWEDLKLEMDFLRQQENVIMNIDGKQVTYQIARSYADIEIADREGKLGETKIIFVPTIEGAHIFDQVMNCYEPADRFPGGIPDDRLLVTLQRVKELRNSKDGLIKPAFITFAHHFWNGLCGHQRSLAGLVKCIINQENGLGGGFKSAGIEVARAMLREETDENGNQVPPILIDIKHMSRKSREDYFEFLKNDFGDRNIPIIVSHGGVTGLSKPGGNKITPAAQEGLYMEDAINFFDDEILKVEQSGGLFGIQLDERRIGSKQALKSARGNIKRRDILFAWSKLVWNQVRHIAEVLDMDGKYAWSIQALGTDFDGIIDPINGYWTAKDLDDLDDYLLKHVFDYLKGIKKPCTLTQERNKTVSAEEVVERIMTSNALNFLSKIY